MSEQKIIHGSLDEIVEAVVGILGDASEGNGYRLTTHKKRWWIEHRHVGSGEPFDQFLRTALERFLAEGSKDNPIGFAEWILHEGFEQYTDNGKCWWGRFNEEKDYSTEQLYDMYMNTTPKKGGDDEA